MFGRRRRTLPQLNTTSTADISFMLLIFFLVTTSMDVDKGLSRRLPPPEKPREEETAVNKRDLMKLVITADNQLLIDDKPCEIKELSKRMETFLLVVGPKHLVQLQANPASNYDTYFRVQNALTKAYSSVRNRISIKRYGRRYDFCSQEEKEEIVRICPQRVIEIFDVKQEGGAQ